MSDLRLVLERFDAEMRRALIDSEMTLRMHGATEDEISTWREYFVPEFEAAVKVQREALIEWCLAELRVLH